MILFINISAFLCVSTVLSRLFKKTLEETIPVTFCLLMVTLFELALIGHLSAIDHISVVICLLSVLYFIVEYCKNGFTSKKFLPPPPPRIFLLIVIYCIVILLSWNLAVTDYDDFSFWATSAKSLYLRNGIEAANRNQAFSFGDYPLGSQLIQWWFMHLAGQWEERWLFIGYSFFLYSFVIPLFPAQKSSIWKWLLYLGTALILPYCSYWFSTRLPPEAAMAAVYACSLLYCIRSVREPQDILFYSISLASFLAALVLLKTIGILWAILAWIFLLLTCVCKCKKKHSLVYSVPAIIPALLLWLQWKYVCIILERTTYLTFSDSSLSALLDTEHMGRALVFLKTLFEEPLHSMPLLGWKVTIAVYFISLGICLFLLIRMLHPLSSSQENKLYLLSGIFLLSTTLIYEASLLYSMLTMFFHESQYQHSNVMILLLSRYSCVPMYSLLFLLIEFLIIYSSYTPKKKVLLTFAICILMFGMNINILPAQVSQAFSGEIPKNQQVLQAKETFTPFFNSLGSLKDPFNSRVLYCDFDNNESWAQVTLDYYSNGTSVIYVEEYSPETLWIAVSNFNITHVYLASEVPQDPLIYAHLTTDGTFSFNTLYEVAEVELHHLLLKQ